MHILFPSRLSLSHAFITTIFLFLTFTNVILPSVPPFRMLLEISFSQHITLTASFLLAAVDCCPNSYLISVIYLSSLRKCQLLPTFNQRGQTPSTYLLISQADMTHDFSGAIPQYLEDHLVNTCISSSSCFFTTLLGITHFVVLTEMWSACRSFKTATGHAEHNYLVVSLYSLVRLHYLPIFKMQQHVKRTETFF